MLSKPPPFRWGAPVADPYFTGRAREVELLTQCMAGRGRIILQAPRRYGKSSIIGRASAASARVGIVVVNVAVDHVTSAGELVALLLGALGQDACLGEGVHGFARQLSTRPTIEPLPDGRTSFGFDVAASPADLRPTLREVVAQLDELAAARPVVLVVDGLQAARSVDPGLAVELAHLAHVNPHLSIVCATSERHLDSEMAEGSPAASPSAPASPSLAFGEVLRIEPVDAGEMATYLRERCSSSGSSMTAGAADRVMALAGPAPNDIQHLASVTCSIADAAVDESVVEDALDELVLRNSASYASTLEELTPIQKRVARLLAVDPRTRLQTADVTRRVGAANPSGVRRALEALVSRHRPLVRQEGASWRVDDPFFAAWLRRTHHESVSTAGSSST